MLLIPRWVDCRRCTFKYGLGDEFIEVLRTLHKLGLDRTEPVDVRGDPVAPRDVVAAALPNPAELGDRMHGKTCAGTLVTGTGRTARRARPTCYHVVDNADTMARDGCQAVVWQTALGPVIAMELLAEGAGRARACSARRRSTPSRSWTCWPSTARRTAVSERDPADPAMNPLAV